MPVMPLEEKYTFTVFTPTYNRASVLDRPYRALCAQTFRDFEWLIVDDGSTDDTAKRVGQWIKEAEFPIRYHQQDNAGKHIAHNRAVVEAMGRYFVVLDSDDGCVPDALERFLFHWKAMPPGDQSKFFAIGSLCRDEAGRVIGDPFPRDVFDSDSLELTLKYGTMGEKWGASRTEVLRQFPFPSILGTYVPESLVWYAISRTYKVRYVNEALRIYYQENTAGEARLTSCVVPQRQAAGRRLFYQAMLNGYADWVFTAPRQFFRFSINYSRMSFHLGLAILEQLKQLTVLGKVLAVAGCPLGYLAFLFDKRPSGRRDVSCLNVFVL